jgi:hypothetical protein
MQFLPLDKILGAMLVGSWINMACFMLELTQIVSYFRTYNDGWLIRAGVILALLADTVSTVAISAGVYLYTIVHWGDLPYLLSQYWPLPLFIISTGVTEVIVQAYLISRYYSLSGNRFVCFLLICLTLTALGGMVSSTITTLLHPHYQDRGRLTLSLIICLSASTAADVAIAAALVWTLSQMVTSFEETKRGIRRIAANTISTGTGTAIIAIGSLVSYVCDMESNVPMILVYSWGRLLTLTMLFNLNTRRSIRAEMCDSAGRTVETFLSPDLLKTTMLSQNQPSRWSKAAAHESHSFGTPVNAYAPWTV